MRDFVKQMSKEKMASNVVTRGAVRVETVPSSLPGSKKEAHLVHLDDGDFSLTDLLLTGAVHMSWAPEIGGDLVSYYDTATAKVRYCANLKDMFRIVDFLQNKHGFTKKRSANKTSELTRFMKHKEYQDLIIANGNHPLLLGKRRHRPL